MSAAIEVRGMTKRFGKIEAVKDLSFEVAAGRVTGFLGPNGAGKSTTLRMLLGLIHPNSGEGTFGGRRYEDLPHPSAQVGVVLEEASFHPGRSGRNHLRVLAAAGNHPDGRVEEVLDAVGLTAAANRRVKGYSMGMRQRLAIAAALLGDPEVLILDEPANGLDPPGIRWMRDLLRSEAGRGRAVLVSSHMLSEVAQAADDVVVIAGGRLRASGTLESFIFILAVVGIAGEWRHRTITSSLLAAPDRLRFLAAKTLAFGAAGAVLSLMISIAVAIVGTLILSLRDLPVPEAGELIAQMGRNALVAALTGALAVGLGALLRNQVVAVVGLLLAGLLIEPTITALLPELGRYGPFTALPTAAAVIPADAAGLGDVDLLAPTLAVLALLAWTGAAFAAGYALLRGRDVH